ncbi:MAG: hypothetical protein OXG64_06540 [Chloroflexi bacterium]|nr:hypothetical protein [Chloroflexota bacterium]
MRSLGAVDDNGPQLLGVMLSCAKNYATLDDLPWDDLKKERLFFAFMNCRILLSTMRSVMQLHNLEYPQQLDRLAIAGDPDVLAELGLSPDGRCTAIFEWARGTESEISRALDSLDPDPPAPPGQSDLSSLRLLNPAQLMLDGSPVVSRILVMFDDVHKLASSQRNSLRNALSGLRESADMWIAERLEALTSEELLEVGAKHGRDYGDVAPTLEAYWRKYPKRFERTVLAIADKRVREAQPVDIDSFSSCVQSSIETPDMRTDVEEALATLESEVRGKWADKKRFSEWLATTSASEGTAYERAVAWQTIDILISRESRRAQLAFEFPLTPGELQKKDDSAARSAAELFLANRFGLPYYFGVSRLALLASSNIEQFLATAGELFEESSSAAILKRPYQLPSKRQHAILKRTARQWWEQDVLRSLPLQSEVRRFVESIGRFARRETFQSNAPYAPGVTGISITMAEREKLRDEEILAGRSDLKDLAEVIAICLAHNILEAELDRSQGYERRMLLYLNRLLCCHFDLPLQYGGWRARRPEELVRWMMDGYRPPSSDGSRLV